MKFAGEIGCGYTCDKWEDINSLAMIGYCEVKNMKEEYRYRYINGCFIYKKPLTARYSCSIDIELMIAERKETYEFFKDIKN